MIPNRLTFINFMSYEFLDLDVSQIRATLIQGPNGAGKSTIGEGCLYAFFGECSRGKDDILIKNGTSDMTVIAEFQMQTGHEYKIVRKKAKAAAARTLLSCMAESEPATGVRWPRGLRRRR